MNKVLSHPLSLLIVTIIAIAFIFSLRATQQKTTSRGEQVDKNQVVVDQLKTEQIQLQQQPEESQLPFNQELILRNELRQQKDGDIVIQIPSVAPQVTPPPSPTPTLLPWEEWRELLFK